MKRLRPTALLLALLVPALNACAPALSGASLDLSPSFLQLRRGSSATVRVSFRRYVYGDEALGGYPLFVSDIGLRGLRVTRFDTSLAADDTILLTVAAARNADLGRQRLSVTVSDPRGRGNVQSTLEIDVVP